MQTQAQSEWCRGLYLDDTPAVVAFTGSGGKTTCGEALAAQAARLGKRVIVTTTTKIRVPPRALDPSSAAQVEAALAERPEPLFIGTAAADGRKMHGPAPPLLDAIIAARCADRVVIEADGSRGASVKGYREGEPVLPAHVDRLCVMVGADAVGAHRDGPLVHRPDTLWARLGLRDAAPLTARDVARALLEQPAYLEGASRYAASIVINKVDDAAAADRAAALIDALGPHAAARGVVQILLRGSAVGGGLAAAWQRPARTAVTGVVLAAGASTRFGACKQTAELNGAPMIVSSLRPLLDSALARIVVVVGHGGTAVMEAVRSHLHDPRLVFVTNPSPEHGLASSIAAGVGALSGEDGVLLALADMPFVQAATIHRLLDVFAHGRHDIVAPVSAGRRGHPVLFDRRFFASLCALKGDMGASPLLRRHAADVQSVRVHDDGVWLDVDTPSAPMAHAP